MKRNIVVENGVINRTCSSCGKKTSYTRRSKPEVCPFCLDKYWDKPEDERNLFILQDQYLSKEKDRDLEILGQMYILIFNYSQNIIINSVKENIFLPEEVIEDKAEDLASTLLEKYLKDATFKVEISFGGFLIQLSKGILYNKKLQKNDKNYSLDLQIDEKLSIENSPTFFINDSNAKKDYEKRAYSQYNQITDNQIVSELNNLIDLIYTKISSSEKKSDSILFLIGFKNFLARNKVSMTDYYNFSGNKSRMLIEKTKMFIRAYLIERKKE